MKKDFKYKLQACETEMFVRNYHIRAMMSKLKPVFDNDSMKPIGKTLCGLDALRDTSSTLSDYDQDIQYKQTYCYGCLEIATASTDVMGHKNVKKRGM